ncbi:Uridine kinase [Tulasnella sp. 425]|nr:Uridine kinase [Tulasnella sp. 425]
MSAVDTGTPITPETFEGLPECPVITRKDGVHKNTILKSHGRPPWYGEDGKPLTNAFVIGIAGGSASGKTFVAEQILGKMEHLPSVVIMSQDSFYNWLTPEQSKVAFENKYDFDHPNAIDLKLFAEAADLKTCKQTNVPKYSFTRHQREDERQYLYGAAIIIVEGILALHDPGLRGLYDLKIFVQCDSDLMLARRIKRDTTERGRDVEGILDQYLRFVKPSYDNFVYPSSKYADIIVPGHDNGMAIELIVTHVKKMLQERSVSFRKRMARADAMIPKALDRRADQLLEGITVLPETPQLKVFVHPTIVGRNISTYALAQGVLTLLRDKNTSRGDFIFQTDRLATIVIEKAMELIPFKSVSVETPVGVVTEGKAIAPHCVCGVSIIRSGGPLEKGLQRVIRDVRLGCLLIQSDPVSGEPLLLYSTLPSCVRERERSKDAWVFVLDAQIVTGAAAFMAIRVILDHGVPEDHIIFVTFLIAQDGGIRALRRAFPSVRFVTGSIDEKLSRESGRPGERDFYNLTPGMGHIGERYF